MYKITEVKISGFWGSYTAHLKFGNDVNIVIGKNGTGKTTFMNILSAVLTVDSVALDENDFTEVVVKLKHRSKVKTIKVTKALNGPYSVVYYSISRLTHSFPLLLGDEARFNSMARRRALEAVSEVKSSMEEFVSIASLSVYRFRAGAEQEARERNRRLMGPVDLHLDRLLQGLTSYQLELSQAARNISLELQRDVLTSLLYRAGDTNKAGYALDFDEERERKDLVSVYKNLGIFDQEVNKRIQDHLAAVKNSVTAIKDSRKQTSPDWSEIDFEPLEAAQRAHSIFKMSLRAEDKTKKIFSHANSFLDLLGQFVDGKRFKFDNVGKFVVEKVGPAKSAVAESIPVEKLSSGEKQLIILFVEALLQRQQPFVFLADEPEISLHIAWQRNIIPAIRLLNPNAQIIVATHSPEVAGKFRSDTIDMEDMLHVNA
ncbi:AAA family ATPase [Pseudomonas simiae]|uniref:AAA family ATPase n=1 Tax=Pseudomonas simiae TaxID=321846 RepID=UPI002734E695|nr:AAA family ATPase [Pseudomonas simiae]WLH16135.1 AAA family ATPase [Pseudomonas simiae]